MCIRDRRVHHVVQQAEVVQIKDSGDGERGRGGVAYGRELVAKEKWIRVVVVGLIGCADVEYGLQLAVEGRDTCRNTRDQLRVLGEGVSARREPVRLDAVAHGLSLIHI